MNRTIALALLLAALAACGSKDVVTPPAPAVSVSQPIVEPIQDMLEFTGRTSAVESVDVRARVTGYVTKVAFTEGAIVNAGDLLFQIDPREYEAAVTRAEGDVAMLRAQLQRAQSEVARNEALRPSGAASARELEKAIADRGSAEGQLKARLAQLDTAKLDLEFTRVTAPISGRVSKAEVRAGNLVVVGASGGPLLTTIVSIDPIQVMFDADERAIIRLRKASIASDGVAQPEKVAAANIPVSMALVDEEDFPHKGTIDFVDNQVDSSTGTIRVRAILPNPDALLAPGLFVRVRVPVGAVHDGVLVTDRAVGTDQDRKYLLVVNDKNVVEYRPVKLGARHGQMREILEGIGPGDWVVVNGLQRARPGATVVPEKVAMRPTATPAAAPAPTAGS